MRTREEIQAQIDATIPSQTDGGSAWPGMTYEEGVDAALRWALGDSDDVPMLDD